MVLTIIDGGGRGSHRTGLERFFASLPAASAPLPLSKVGTEDVLTSAQAIALPPKAPIPRAEVGHKDALATAEAMIETLEADPIDPGDTDGRQAIRLTIRQLLEGQRSLPAVRLLMRGIKATAAVIIQGPSMRRGAPLSRPTQSDSAENILPHVVRPSMQKSWPHRSWP